MVSSYFFECSECFYEQKIEGDYIVGEVISCPDCGIDLEIIDIKQDLSKLILQPAELEDETWGE